MQPFKYSLSEGEIERPIGNNSEVQVNNSGNVFSKPILTLNGSGTCGVYLNGSQAFSVDFTINDEITIDTDAMEAYSGTTLRNRIVTGGYENLYLPTGVNILKFTGSVTNCIIENYSRWV